MAANNANGAAATMGNVRIRCCLLDVAAQRTLPLLSLGSRRVEQVDFKTVIRGIFDTAVVLGREVDVGRCRSCRGVHLYLSDL